MKRCFENNQCQYRLFKLAIQLFSCFNFSCFWVGVLNVTLDIGISDEIEVATISFDKTTILEIKARIAALHSDQV